MNKAASFATFVALALLGVVLAYWSWQWRAPRPVPLAPGVEAESRASSAGALFGSARQGPGAAATAPGTLRLMGIVWPSHAVLRLEAKKTVAVPLGGEVEPGLRLAEVHVDHVVLERNGARETLAWPEKKGK